MLRARPCLGFLVAGLATFAATGAADATRLPCGPPIARVGAHAPTVGPIQFRAIRLAAVGATKVLLWVGEPTRGEVVITGARCADGTKLRFWYGAKPDLPDTLTPTTGDLSFALHGAPGSNHPGFFLPSKPGDWKLTVSRRGKPIGTLTFCVAETAYVNAPCA